MIEEKRERRPKKWANESDRSRAYQLRKTINPKTNLNWTDEEIQTLFYHRAKEVSTIPVSGPSHPPQQPPTNPIVVPKYVKETAEIQAYFTNINLQCTTQAAMQLKEKADQIAQTTYIPPYTRSPNLYKRQNEVIDAINDPDIQVIFLEGDKRTGKSTSAFCGICESVWNGTITRWGFWSVTLKNAMSILKSVKLDPITVESTRPLYNGIGTDMRLLFFNGGVIEVGATENPSSMSGQAYQGIWIDEVHNVITENPNTFAMIAMILRSEPHLKLILTANQGTTAFQMLRQELADNIDPKRIAFFTLLFADVKHITVANDKLVRVLVNASAGPEMASQFLDNQYVREGDLIYPISAIKEAYDGNIPLPRPEQYESFGCGVDWGNVHDTSIIIGGFLDNHMYEQETIYLQHANDILLMSTFRRIITQYPGLTIAWENSPLGSFIRNTIREEFPDTQFVDSGFTNHKQEYIDNVYCWLVMKCLHLKDSKLKHQLIQYKNDKKNDDGHDALAHLLYQCQPPRTMEDVKFTFIENRQGE